LTKLDNPAYLQHPPKKPVGGTWSLIPDGEALEKKFQGFRYVSPLGIRVMSSVHVVENATGGGVSPHYHISISDNGQRIAASVVPTILAQFDASDFEEDNHSPLGVIRSFWKPVSGPVVSCPCEDEKPIIEGDYVWRPDPQKRP